MLERMEEPKNNSTLDILLNKPDVTLKEVLDDEEVIQGLKCGDKRLIEYLTKPESLTGLTAFCVTDPTTNDDDRKKYKYGHLASEIISADIQPITEALGKCTDCFRLLFSFVSDSPSSSSPPMRQNALLASFFSKVFILLAAKQLSQVLDYMQSEPQVLTNLVSSLDVSAIMESLFRLAYGNENEEDTLSMKEWLAEQEFISKVISQFDESRSVESHQNASFLLCELIRFLRNAQYSKDEKTADPLLEQLQSPVCLKALLGRMFPADAASSSDSVVLNGCSIFMTYLQTVYIPHNPLAMIIGLGKAANQYNENAYSETADITIDATTNTEVAIWTPDPDRIVEQCLLERLEDLKRVLTDRTKNEPMTLPMGVIDAPLGSVRVTLVKLLVQLLANGLPEIHSAVARLELVQKLLDLLFKHKWNNILHTSVANAILCAYYCRLPYLVNVEHSNASSDKMMNGPNQSCTKNSCGQRRYYPSPLLKQLMASGHILKLLVENCLGYLEAGKLSGSAPAYIGHLLLIASITHSAMQCGPHREVMQEMFQALPEDERKPWNQFVENHLLPYLKRCEPDKVGSLARGDMDMVSGKAEDFGANDSASLEQATAAFDEYNNLKVTIDIPEEFGYAADAFTTDHEEPVYQLMTKAADINFELGPIPQATGEAAFEEMCAQRINLCNDSDDEDLEYDRPVASAQ